jgi:hypothetical protein
MSFGLVLRGGTLHDGSGQPVIRGYLAICRGPHRRYRRRRGPRTTVVVNGVPVVENAAHTGALPGTALKRDARGHVS